jgi:signal transduction histidine kinase
MERVRVWLDDPRAHRRGRHSCGRAAGTVLGLGSPRCRIRRLAGRQPPDDPGPALVTRTAGVRRHLRVETWYLSQLIWLILLPMFGMSCRQFEIQARQTGQLLRQTQLAQQEHARAAALDERGRIARELHDVLAHSLGALNVQLELAEALLDERQDTARHGR